MAVVDSRSLELWLQSGIPEDGDLVFNVHLRNLATSEWEASYRLSQFAALDVEINKLTDALRDVAFPTINKEALQSLVTNKKYPNKLKDLEHCRMSLEQWVYYVISRIDILPIDLRNIVENFFMLPNGPHYSADETTLASSSSIVAPKPGEYKSPTLADLHSTDGQSDVWDDEVSETRTEWTVGSLDENGKPKKKKKRIIKGIKKRVSNILGTGSSSSKPKEGFGMDFSGVDGELPPGAPVATKSMVSGVSSGGSDHGRPSVASSTGVQQVQPATLLKVRVSRGGEKSRGHHEYEIYLTFNEDKKPYTVTHVFADFLALYNSITEAKGIGVASVFPPSHSKSSLGIGLSEDQHAERTRLLDAWVKDAVSSYQYMTDKERTLFRTFLGFNLSRPKDIYIHDKMANGMVEAPRAQAFFGTNSAVNNAEVFSSKVSDSGSSKVSGTGESSNGRLPAARRGTGLSRAASTASTVASSASPAPRNYSVKVLTTGNLSSSYVRPNSRTKLDLRQMDGTIFTDENSVDSRTNLEEGGGGGGGNGYSGNSGKHGGGGKGKERGNSGEMNTRQIPNLSLIHEEDMEDLDLSRRNTGMEEDLLRIGMKKDKKKSTGCCCCS